MAQFSGQDTECAALADANNVYICKRRSEYMYCTFLSAGDRTAYKAALSGVSGVTFADYALSSRPSYYIVKVEPT